MRLKYSGVAREVIRAHDYDKVVGKIKKGKIFRCGALNFYCKLSKYKPNVVADGVFLLDMVCATSDTTRRTCFVRVEKSDNENDAVFFGKALEEYILSDLRDWAIELNPKTMTAFGGRRFKSYLNAIPSEVLSKEDFLKRAKNALSAGFRKRDDKVAEAESITKSAVDILKLSLKRKTEGEEKKL